ncbi:PIG-L deacetylase family protein [Solidesulfovibrio magneticus]|uniref:LmbE-like protein n=1 Tax=Solidesulfovibrio magneticus (strain ATCC 700980 / DSM 13731 / RS-1) TaxID=573370 RepID=C4XTF1_SOLM1|nr:PIG-L deacetylase family protein [Solidesulfovibrio magneticus]BAH75948.1 hypothetical protein DMR_24570 [Solidesulfovibrio magneticus RS-1]
MFAHDARDSVLVIAAHPDDETLGCGATIARLTASGQDVHVVFAATGAAARHDAAEIASEAVAREVAALKADAGRAGAVLEVASQTFLDFPDNRLDTVPLMDLAQSLKQLVADLRPGIVFTHHFGDYNWDHGRVHEATLMACRANPGEFYPRHLYSYEVLSSTERTLGAPHRLFAPNVFVDATATLDRKIAALQCYASELGVYPHPRSPEAVRQLAGVRGSSVGIHFAEAFQLLRTVHVT